MAVEPSSGSEDPGWSYALRGWWLVLLPFPLGVLLRRFSRRAERQATMLELTRALFVSFAGAFLLIGFVVVILARASSLTANRIVGLSPMAVAVVTVGATCLAAPSWIERPLDCSDDARLVASYRVRFFLRLAFAEATVLLGFVGFLLTGRWWMYPLGGAFAAAGLVRLAPTAGNLATDQEELRAVGCSRSLLGAMTIPPSPSP